MLSKKTIGFLLKIGIVTFALFFLFKQLTDKTTINQFNSTDVINQINSRQNIENHEHINYKQENKGIDI